MKPALLVIAGPNGSGKTTITGRLRQDHWSDGVDGVEARLCARTRDGQLRKVHGPLPEWVAAEVDGLARHPSFVDARVT